MIRTTPLNDAFVYEPKVLKDDRGYFFESYNAATFHKESGLDIQFIQDNQARSVKNVLRGLHFQKLPFAQSKLVRVLEGTIWDVIVDIRKGSSTYGQWYGVELSAENKLQLFVPAGFAHGYAVLTDNAEVFYKCDALYHKESEGGLTFDDSRLAIDWKIDLNQANLSEKDKQWPTLDKLNFEF